MTGGRESEEELASRTLFGFTPDALRGIGVLLLVVGGLFWIGAFVVGATFRPPDTLDFQARADAMQANFMETAFLAFLGFVLLALGGTALRFGLIRPVSRYMASEAAPALSTVAESVAAGVSQGLSGSSGIPVRVVGPAAGSGVQVRVKCRNCGYLDTEDAAYCSKCGKPL